MTSGVVALMLTENPDLTPDQVKYALMAAAEPAVYDDSDAGLSVFQQGAGRVWAPDAVFAGHEGEANAGMTPGEPYIGPVVFRDGTFHLVDENGADLADGAGYGWAGGYGWATRLWLGDRLRLGHLLDQRIRLAGRER